MSAPAIIIEGPERSRTGAHMGSWPRVGFDCDDVQALDAPECIARGGLIAVGEFAFASDLARDRIRWEGWMA